MPKKLTEQLTAYNNNIPLDLSLPKTLKDAVIKRDYRSLKRLLEKKANPNEQDINGLTPLHFAVKDNRLYMVSSLIKSGAHIIVKDKNGYTPLDYASIYNHISLKNLLEQRFRNKKNKISFRLFKSKENPFISKKNENIENDVNKQNISCSGSNLM